MARLIAVLLILSVGLASAQNYDKVCRTLLLSCQTFQTECQTQNQPQLPPSPPNRPSRPQNPAPPPQPQPQPPRPNPQPGFDPNPVISPPQQCVLNGKGCNTSEECCSLNCKVETITMGNDQNKFTIKVCR